MGSGWRRTVTAGVVVGIVGVVSAAPALAASPANDTEATAVQIEALPFEYAQDTSEATPNGPRFCSNNASVFFSFTPARDQRVQVDLIGSQYDTVLSVYTRTATGKVHAVDCSDDRFGLASGVRFRAHSGTTYVFMVAQCCGNGDGGGGQLVLWMGEVVDVELEFTVDLDDPGTVDPSTGIATIGGTITCNERSVVYRYGVLRELREGLFVARGSWSAAAACTPNAPAAWTAEVDTETGVAFGSGSAVIRDSFVGATDGFRDNVGYSSEDETIHLV